MSDNIFICKICNKKCSNLKSLSHHLHSKHNLIYQRYFIQYIEPWFHKCPYCNNERKWTHGKFNTTCSSKECIIKSNKDGYINSNHKRKQTCFEKFNCEYPGQSDSILEKKKQTMLSKYGVENPMQSISIKNKIKETMNIKYDVDYAAQSKEIYEKIRKTCQERYGGIGFASDILFEKHKKSCFNKYGAQFPLQNKDICQKQQKFRAKHNIKNIYNNIYFDSKSEMDFYVYCLNRNLNIIYKPEPIEYIDTLNIKHQYFPDFKIENQLYEIKGTHFFDNDGNYRTPWCKGLTEDEYKKVIIRDTAKFQCMKENNVIIILHTEVIELIKNNSALLIERFKL